MDERKPIKNLAVKVEETLRDNPKTRNSDVLLTQAIIYRYLNSHVKQDEQGKWWFSADSFYIVREDNVKRIRAKIQNIQHKYLPDNPVVRKARNIKEEDWRKFLGYNPEMREVIEQYD